MEDDQKKKVFVYKSEMQVILPLRTIPIEIMKNQEF